jgi:hypothetical protein
MLHGSNWLVLTLLLGLAALVFFGLVGDAKDGRRS